MRNQIIPFNNNRFDAVMVWFCTRKNHPLTQYDMVKLHVLADCFHLLDCGKPIIGGALEKWPYGPVVKRAYDRAMLLAYRADEGKPSAPFEVKRTQDNIHEFRPAPGVEVDDSCFSESEVEAMDMAWSVLMVELQTWQAREEYFHKRSGSFIGEVYEQTDDNQRQMDWCAIIEAFDRRTGQDHSAIRELLALGV